MKFGAVTRSPFAALASVGDDGVLKPLGVDRVRGPLRASQGRRLVDAKGVITDDLRRLLRDKALVLPEAFAPRGGSGEGSADQGRRQAGGPQTPTTVAPSR
jgi:hypothetical protein